MSVAVVTGAAGGTNRACAERLVAEGWQVAAPDLANADVDGALASGWVDTPGNRATGRMEAALASVPLGRAATPEEMADLVWFLAGEGRARYVTVETPTATGGSAFR